MTKKGRKVLLVILISVIAILVALIFSLNLILGNVLETSIDSQMALVSKESNKNISVDKVSVNIFSRTIILKNISIAPDSSLIESLKNGKLNQASVMKIDIPILKFQGFSIFKLAVDRNFTLNKILVKGAEFTIFKGDFRKKIEEDKDATPPISIDSIYIKGLNGINLSKIVIDQYSYTTINVKSNDTIFSFGGSDFEIKGIDLQSSQRGDGFFVFNNEKLSLKMRQQRIDLRDANYFIYLKKLDFSFADSLIEISNLQVKPTRDKYKLGHSYKFTKEVFDVELKLISIYGNKIGKIIREGIIDIDSILIDGLKLDLFKDRTRPFDLDKRPLFIQQQLKQLKQPLHISKIKVTNSDFIYALRPEGSEKLLNVDISNFSGEIVFVTSLRDSIRSGKKLKINLKGKLMGESALDLNVIMPYNSPVDTFYFAGTLGPADFTKFNPALYPATGIKFESGKLKSLKFYAHASPKSSKGLMTMLYEGLEAEIPQKDVHKKNKFLSFSANAVLRAANPNKKGNTRVAQIKFERVKYKGFGNLLWKSVQTGLVNTILPTGKAYKDESIVDEQEKKASSKEEKKKRRKRKKK